MSSGKCQLFNRELLGEIRGRFACIDSDPFTGKRIYLENAGGGMTLNSVLETVAVFTSLPDNAGRDNSTSHAISKAISMGIEDLKIFFGVKSGTVSLAESTTANSYKILHALIANVPGTNVVTTDLDHPSVYDATRQLAKRYRKEWRCARTNPKTAIVEPAEICRHVDKSTSVLAIIHSSNNTGTQNDAKEIIRHARSINPELYVLVDGSQHAPHCLVDIESLDCDAYLISSYKTFSKAGASVLCLSQRASVLPHDRLEGKPINYWELGTRETAGYAAWSKVVEYFCWLGKKFCSSNDPRTLIAAAFKAINSHERALSFRMLKGSGTLKGLLGLKKVSVCGEVEDLTLRDPVFLFNVRGMTTEQVVSALGQKGIRVTNRVSDAYSVHTLKALGITEGVRVSAAHYTSDDEVDIFLKALEEVSE